jgi:hypothetical protein
MDDEYESFNRFIAHDYGELNQFNQGEGYYEET